MSSAKATALYDDFEIIIFKITTTIPRGQWVNIWHEF